MYFDTKGREIFPKFRLGGFNDDITVVDLYQYKVVTIFFIFKKKIKLKRFSHVSTASINEVANWTDDDYHALTLAGIEKYNKETVSREILETKFETLNLK